MKKYTAPLACLAIAIAVAIAIGSRVDKPVVYEAKLDHTFTGVCTHVIDGDTIDCSNGTEVKRVRLRGIDAPESKQPFGTAAKMYLAKRLEKRAVTVVWRKTEKYGRLLGDVYAGDLHVNEDLIHAGLAWRYYEKSPAWDKLQAEAKARHMGLWSDQEAIEPSKWRAGERPKPKTVQHDE